MNFEDDYDRNVRKVGVKTVSLSYTALYAAAKFAAKKLTAVKAGENENIKKFAEKVEGKLLSVEMQSPDSVLLNDTCKKLGIGYSVVETSPERYTVFFSAASEHRMAAALKLYETKHAEKEQAIRDWCEGRSSKYYVPLSERIKASKEIADARNEAAREANKDKDFGKSDRYRNKAHGKEGR